ncbi:DUF3732 domain-containing protein [Absiella sp. AM29-15]|uniref:DUF3732 domain-containing protein n=1 Tax=Absiella sp. AM29-15 TaxID=2292278 RepID=UPI000E411F6D|nr:DUF3732 domain-containing protein [Absiella sp. AM29-15]RGC53347.1 DUF3732 domain-containing protein [Absiella sp. AM29-15]
MQIKEIIIYGKNGKIRRLSFNLGKLNIITGNSKSGKTAVGEIINYCLGGSSCNISDGVVRENSTWYAIILQLENEQIFIARKNPKVGKQTTNACYVEIGKEILIPENKDFEANDTVEGVEELISKRLKINENLNIPPEGQTRGALAANIRHALYYCFQFQDEIAARSFLFHRQAEPFITQSIKDTLPYFLGIVNEKALELENERMIIKRKLAIEKRKLDELEMLQGGGMKKALTLISEAKAVGLLSSKEDYDIDNFDEIFYVLSSIEEWKPKSVEVIGMDKISYLQNQLDSLQTELVEINEDIFFAKSFNGETEGFSTEAEHQKLRLSSIGLFDKLNFDPGHCPLCSNVLTNPIPEVDMIKTAIEKLDANIKNVSKEKPKLRKHIDGLEKRRQQIKEEIQKIKYEIDGIYNHNKEAKKLRDLYTRRAKIVGRISLWVESVADKSDVNSIKLAIKELQGRLDEIDNLLDKETLEDRKQSVLSRISSNMTKWAQTLELEHLENPYRLDMNKVTVVVDKPDRPVPLRQLGSGSNWVGVHLIVYFALQKYFIENARPVPQFIFIDQPSQVYFPSGEEEEDIDWKMVEKMYDFIYNQVQLLSGKLQVIVVDHANLENNENFMSSVLEDWHKGTKLIPDDWY